MEKAGYDPVILEKLRGLRLEHDFYLVHWMKEKEYDRSWRLFYPKGL
jgi:hypothetical protein